MISIHCDPDFEYPFHSGFADEDGAGPGKGATLHLPLAPGTGWKDGYHAAMETAMSKVRDFGATALVVSMGLDTLDKDPCALRRAGLRLSGKDYYEMGQTIGHDFDYPVVFVQEGGYFLKLVPDATREVLTGFAAAKASSKKARKV